MTNLVVNIGPHVAVHELRAAPVVDQLPHGPPWLILRSGRLGRRLLCSSGILGQQLLTLGETLLEVVVGPPPLAGRGGCAGGTDDVGLRRRISAGRA